jgi:hypothetical protein
MLALFRICTFEDWTDIMYTNIYGCEEGGYSPYPEGADTGPDRPGVGKCSDDQDPIPLHMGVIAAFYFILFSIISAMVLLTLFIGVISTAMEEAQEKNKEKQVVAVRMRKLQKHFNIPPIAVSNWIKFFGLLDIDESGTLDMDEIKSGFDSVYYSTDKSLFVLQRVCDKGEIEPDKYIHYMYAYSMALLGTDIPLVFGPEGRLLYGDDLEGGGADSPTETSSVFSERTFANRAGIAGGSSLTPERRLNNSGSSSGTSPRRIRAPTAGARSPGSRNGSRATTPDPALTRKPSGHRR